MFRALLRSLLVAGIGAGAALLTLRIITPEESDEDRPLGAGSPRGSNGTLEVDADAVPPREREALLKELEAQL